MPETLPIPVGQPGMLVGENIARAEQSAAAYALQEKSEATRRAYRSDFADFTRWCSSAGVLHLPASATTLAAYLACLADRGLRAATIARRAAAIGYAHRLAGQASPTADEAVKAVHRGIRRRIGVAARRKAPADARVAARMVKAIPDTLAGKRDRALLLIGFAAALRRSELVALDVEDLERAPEGVLITIRRSKTDQEGAGQTVAVPNGRKLSPVAALDAWLAAAGIKTGAIFRRVGKGARVLGRLSDRSVAEILKKGVARAGFDASLFSGHSLRAGFVTSSLEHGADVLKVMDQTRHRSVETLRPYDRRARAFKGHAGTPFL